jgi:NAD(P)-dependent dehydrogenase (short-subunit alcohol dehydrogenase family)
MKILENKTAVIYGAGGSLGGAVAMAFSEAGARFSDAAEAKFPGRKQPQ